VYLYDLERRFFLLHSYGKTVILKYILKTIFSEHRSEPGCLSGEVSCGLLDTDTVSSRIGMQAGLRKQNVLKKAGFFCCPFGQFLKGSKSMKETIEKRRRYD
jgi:hypothetical protein